ncbi:hypothetical protein HKD32_04760 [Gluconobacter japonicus]|uniref:Uncharacterized protein n=2 Tax=Gluconobacter japonicus TaxID=376620 RepID=A0A9Q2FKG3_GLUJA|nr:hypothetical protein [Gluconobacter japonicus]
MPQLFWFESRLRSSACWPFPKIAVGGWGVLLMRALSVFCLGFALGLPLSGVQAQSVSHDAQSVQSHLVEDAGMSGVDRRLIVCRINPKLLHTAWVGEVKDIPHPQVCTGGANRLGAGYVRYLATSRVSKTYKPLRG